MVLDGYKMHYGVMGCLVHLLLERQTACSHFLKIEFVNITACASNLLDYIVDRQQKKVRFVQQTLFRTAVSWQFFFRSKTSALSCFFDENRPMLESLKEIMADLKQLKSLKPTRAVRSKTHPP